MIPAPEIRSKVLRHPLFQHLDADVQDRLLAEFYVTSFLWVHDRLLF